MLFAIGCTLSIAHVAESAESLEQRIAQRDINAILQRLIKVAPIWFQDWKRLQMTATFLRGLPKLLPAKRWESWELRSTWIY